MLDPEQVRQQIAKEQKYDELAAATESASLALFLSDEAVCRDCVARWSAPCARSLFPLLISLTLVIRFFVASVGDENNATLTATVAYGCLAAFLLLLTLTSGVLAFRVLHHPYFKEIEDRQMHSRIRAFNIDNVLALFTLPANFFQISGLAYKLFPRPEQLMDCKAAPAVTPKWSLGCRAMVPAATLTGAPVGCPSRAASSTARGHGTSAAAVPKSAAVAACMPRRSRRSRRRGYLWCLQPTAASGFAVMSNE